MWSRGGSGRAELPSHAAAATRSQTGSSLGRDWLGTLNKWRQRWWVEMPQMPCPSLPRSTEEHKVTQGREHKNYLHKKTPLPFPSDSQWKEIYMYFRRKYSRVCSFCVTNAGCRISQRSLMKQSARHPAGPCPSALPPICILTLLWNWCCLQDTGESKETCEETILFLVMPFITEIIKNSP